MKTSGGLSPEKRMVLQNVAVPFSQGVGTPAADVSASWSAVSANLAPCRLRYKYAVYTYSLRLTECNFRMSRARSTPSAISRATNPHTSLTRPSHGRHTPPSPPTSKPACLYVGNRYYGFAVLAISPPSERRSTFKPLSACLKIEKCSQTLPAPCFPFQTPPPLVSAGCFAHGSGANGLASRRAERSQSRTHITESPQVAGVRVQRSTPHKIGTLRQVL